MDIWHAITLALTVSAAAAAFIFVGAYIVGSPWWKNATGLNTMAFMSVVAVTLILAVFYRVTSGSPPPWLGVIIWGMINVPLWWKVVILWQAQHGKYDVRPHDCTSCGELCNG